MVQSGVGAKVVERAGGARLRVTGAEHHVSDPGVDRRAGAHCARLQRDHQGGIVETPSTEGGSRITQGEYFSVGGRVARSFALVVPGGNDLSVDDNQRPHGNIAVAQGQDSLGEGEAHQCVEIEICGSGTGHPADPTHVRSGATGVASNPEGQPGGRSSEAETGPTTM